MRRAHGTYSEVWARVTMGFATGSIALAVICAPSTARAAEGAFRVGAEGGVGTLLHRGTGPLVGAYGAYGLTESFDLVAEYQGSWDGRTNVHSGSIGLAYTLDVIQWVPYVALLGGYYYYSGDPGPNGEHRSVAGASVELGVDYLFARDWSAGAGLRWHASFREGVNLPLFTGTLNVAYRWGY